MLTSTQLFDHLSRMSLLYVEDEPLIRQNAVEYLSRYCDRVYEASDGLEGYEAYQTYAPHLIITDIRMPRLDGLQLATRIRTRDRRTPILISTAYTDTPYLLRAVELGLIKYLVKPVTADKLREGLAMAVEALTFAEENRIITLDRHTRYDPINQSLFRDDVFIKLTHNERLLLDLLARHRERVVTYEEIEGVIWPYEGMSRDALRTLIHALRRKLPGDGIANVSGVGYRLHTRSGEEAD